MDDEGRHLSDSGLPGLDDFALDADPLGDVFGSFPWSPLVIPLEEEMQVNWQQHADGDGDDDAFEPDPPRPPDPQQRPSAVEPPTMVPPYDGGGKRQHESESDPEVRWNDVDDLEFGFDFDFDIEGLPSLKRPHLADTLSSPWKNDQAPGYPDKLNGDHSPFVCQMSGASSLLEEESMADRSSLPAQQPPSPLLSTSSTPPATPPLDSNFHVDSFFDSLFDDGNDMWSPSTQHSTAVPPPSVREHDVSSSAAMASAHQEGSFVSVADSPSSAAESAPPQTEEVRPAFAEPQQDVFAYVSSSVGQRGGSEKTRHMLIEFLVDFFDHGIVEVEISSLCLPEPIRVSKETCHPCGHLLVFVQEVVAASIPEDYHTHPGLVSIRSVLGNKPILVTVLPSKPFLRKQGKRFSKDLRSDDGFQKLVAKKKLHVIAEAYRLCLLRPFLPTKNSDMVGRLTYFGVMTVEEFHELCDRLLRARGENPPHHHQ